MIRNNCTFRGNLTRDPELRRTNSGAAVVNFGLAVSGYKKDEVEFIDCEAWEKRAEFIAETLSKGDHVIIQSRFRADNYTDKDGAKRRSVKFVVDDIEVLKVKKWSEEKGNSGGGGGDDDGDDEENIKF